MVLAVLSGMGELSGGPVLGVVVEVLGDLVDELEATPSLVTMDTATVSSSLGDQWPISDTVTCNARDVIWMAVQVESRRLLSTLLGTGVPSYALLL